ncbi:hypothetical protein [Streptomyces murinus]|uniref:hypothetical protein n=1 Tax=Streptomyces murinus TaxID=33900 RepID=UPI0018F777D2|nr:hypothetical protein [Streptomyces murinus]
MSARLDVEELLRAGYGDRTIARRLGVAEKSVTRARAALRMAAGRPGPKGSTSPEDAFWRRAQPTDDGHLLWPGFDRGNGARVRCDGRLYSVHRIAWHISHQREPAGRVLSGCGRIGCVHPAHVEDQTMRTQYTAIFGA